MQHILEPFTFLKNIVLSLILHLLIFRLYFSINILSESSNSILINLSFKQSSICNLISFISTFFFRFNKFSEVYCAENLFLNKFGLFRFHEQYVTEIFQGLCEDILNNNIRSVDLKVWINDARKYSKGNKCLVTEGSVLQTIEWEMRI